MKPTLFLLLALTAVPAGLAAPAPQEVVVYVYDAFKGKGSLAEAVQQRFEKIGGKSRVVAFPNAGEALNQIAIEGKKTKADVLIGVDEGLLGRARELKAFDTLPPKLSASIDPALSLDSEGRFVPFDYSYLSILYDSRVTTPPAGLSLKDFASKPEYKKSLALQDPRTSSTGLSFLVWTHLAFGEGTAAFWKSFSDQILTVASGWTGTYGLFLKGEAKFVVSYTTSSAYHIELEKKDNIRAFLFPEGHYRQTEGVGLVSHSKNKEWARKWIETLLSKEVQEELPTRQWMYPAVKGTALPASFEKLPRPAKVLTADATELQKKRNGWLKDWTSSVSGIKP